MRKILRSREERKKARRIAETPQRSERIVTHPFGPMPPVGVAEPASAATRKRKRRSRGGGGGSWRHRGGDLRAGAPNVPPSDAEVAAAAELEVSHSASALRDLLRTSYGLRPGARDKSGLALRIVRARRAEAASERIYGKNAANAHRPPRFDGQRAGSVHGSLDACRLCAGEIAAPRRTFCCDECVHFHLLRTSGSHVRKALALRDAGRCALCGVDAAAACREARRAVREAVAHGTPAVDAALACSVADGPFAGYARLGGGGRRRVPRVSEGSFWQADHAVAVQEGGGCCGLSNLRTLCSPCHAVVTAEHARRRADERRRATSATGEASRAHDVECAGKSACQSASGDASGSVGGSALTLLLESDSGDDGTSDDDAHDTLGPMGNWACEVRMEAPSNDTTIARDCEQGARRPGHSLDSGVAARAEVIVLDDSDDDGDGGGSDGDGCNAEEEHAFEDESEAEAVD